LPGIASGRFSSWYGASDYGTFISRQLTLGKAPVQLMEVGQPRGDYVTPGTTDLVIGLVLNPGVRAEMDFGDGAFEYGSGPSAAFASPSQTQSRVVADGWHHALLLSVPQRDADRIFQETGLGQAAYFGGLHATTIDDGLVAASLRRLAAMADDGLANALLADGITHDIVLSLARGSRAPVHRLELRRRGGLSPYKLRRVQELLGSNLADDISLADAASLAGQSTFHFCRAFKQSTGASPYQWRVMRRISHACDRLLNSQDSVSEIAQAVGYGSAQALGKEFRRHLGMSASDYRAHFRGR